jgi:molybdopterin molybdotransferase
MRHVLTLEEYRDELLTLVEPEGRFEDVPIGSCSGRILATPLASRVNLPVFDNSAMDGYAVRFDDVVSSPARLRVVGEIPAGSPLDPPFGPGECVRIMTGAPMPGAADTVVPIEDTTATPDGSIIVNATPVMRGSFVRLVGEDVAAGTTVTPAGRECDPYLVAFAAAGGATSIRVRPRPVVAVCATGDELVSNGAPLRRGQVYDSNSLALAAALRRDGADATRYDPLRDNAETLTSWLNRVQADLVVLTGGASVGAYDVVRDVLERAGGTFRHVRMQPGKPQGWALWMGRPVVALPGNPLSAELSYEVFVRPMLDRILGRFPEPDRFAVTATGWPSPMGRRQLVPVRVHGETDGRLVATPSHDRRSASFLVSSLAEADGYVAVPEDVVQVVAGDVLRLRTLRRGR